MKCITYLRVASSDITDQQMGFNYQQKIISDFVIKNNYEVIKTIREVGSGITGKSELILNHIKKQKVDAVVCTSVDRISRKHDDFMRLKYLLDIAGVKLIFADTEHEVEQLSPFDKATQGLLEALRTLEKEELSRRIKMGIERRKKYGNKENVTQ